MSFVIPLNLLVIITVVFGLYMMKSWRFDVDKCKTPVTPSPKKEMMWNIIEFIIFMSLVVLMMLAHKSNPYGPNMIMYAIGLLALGAMEIVILLNKNKVKQGNCEAKVQNLLAGMMFDGFIIAICLYSIISYASRK